MNDEREAGELKAEVERMKYKLISIFLILHPLLFIFIFKEAPITTAITAKLWGFLPLPTELADGLRLEGVFL